MSLPCLIWADLRINRAASSPVGALEEQFQVRRVVERAAIPLNIDQATPLLSCFEYDYPDVPSLQALRSTKQAYPSLPILMLTLQHSEALAVWAFRTRVWDFLVQPVTAEQLSQRIAALLPVLPTRGQECREIAMPVPFIPRESRIGAPGLSMQAAQLAANYVEHHYSETLRLRDVAGSCQMDACTFSRTFKRAFGLTFREYLCRFRLERSRELLANPRATVSEVACAVGMSNVSHFTRTFHQRMGITPTEYRRDATPQNTHKSLQ
ncbi:DNA-binding response regulator [Pseudomonas sp. JM0905a]|uniref:helix-turn-helix domain-containing protein n=1 Tax=Pseudomonas sp. JM0905a TaxID=2772484 RepID=UPI00168366B8|nr:DNA-binding response regulator [Pseudomonas sp. JM0905a]MBD2837295.1 DNA-binding response regulator [Pseudomonas sp. JM0905a]